MLSFELALEDAQVEYICFEVDKQARVVRKCEYRWENELLLEYLFYSEFIFLHTDIYCEIHVQQPSTRWARVLKI